MKESLLLTSTAAIFFVVVFLKGGYDLISKIRSQFQGKEKEKANLCLGYERSDNQSQSAVSKGIEKIKKRVNLNIENNHPFISLLSDYLNSPSFYSPSTALQPYKDKDKDKER